MSSAAFTAAQAIMIQRAKLISNATITTLLPNIFCQNTLNKLNFQPKF
jgi:hypothetical protein